MYCRQAKRNPKDITATTICCGTWRLTDTLPIIFSEPTYVKDTYVNTPMVAAVTALITSASTFCILCGRKSNSPSILMCFPVVTA